MGAPKQLLREIPSSDAELSQDRNFVTALARGLELLRCFGPEDEMLGNAELARRTGIPKPTVSRLTYTLTRLGYLRYVESLERYQLGPGVLALGYSYLAGSAVRSIARPLMQSLAEATDCQVALGSPDRLKMVYTEACQGAGPMVLRLGIGSRVPMATSAMGRAFLAAIPEAERKRYCDAIREQEPEHWPQIEEGLEQALEDYQKRGFCISEGEWDGGVSGVGVPLIMGDSGTAVAFNCGGSSLRLSRRVLEENLGPRLRELVRQVKEELSGTQRWR